MLIHVTVSGGSKLVESSVSQGSFARLPCQSNRWMPSAWAPRQSTCETEGLRAAETQRSYGHLIGLRGTSAGLNTSTLRGGLAMLFTTPFPAVRSLPGRLHTCQGGLPLA